MKNYEFKKVFLLPVISLEQNLPVIFIKAPFKRNYKWST